MPAQRPPPGFEEDAAGSRLRRLFDAALEQAQAGRAAWINAHVADDGQRRDLRRLLDAHATTTGALDLPIDQRAMRIGDIDEPEPDSLIGQRIGAFRLLSLLGQGGMATVFLGERADADFAQQAAVKLLRRNLYSDLERRMFRRERQALAALSHPNIAHLIDGGITDAGIPYLAMEYVEGVPITRFADAHRLNLRARLQLFVSACTAVAAAHHALIVHRDIKPSNILVTPTGMVKLLDFGIAKLLEEGDDATCTELVALTPGYAAPEQLTGGAISTATDVYALGVLLHELLLGERPAHADPTRPSGFVRSSAAAKAALPIPAPVLRRALRGDLDNILAKALASEPARRYASADALAEDVEHYLQARPVNAHPPSNAYRARKFVQRHRSGVALSTALAIGLLGGLGMSLWQAELARREAVRANSVRDFVEHLFDPVREGLPEGRMPSSRDLVAAGVDRLDAAPRMDTAVRVDLLTMFSRLNADLGELQRAQSLARSANALARARLDPMDPLAIRALATRGQIATLSEDFDHAAADLHEAQRRMQRAGTRGEALIDLLDALADVENSRGRAGEVLRLERQALAERKATWGEGSRQMGAGFENLGFALEGAAQYDEAAAAWHRAYLTHLRFTGPDSIPIAIAMQGEASSLWRAGRWQAARRRFVAAERMLDRVGVKPDKSHANTVGKLCQLEGALADRKAATVDCARALALARIAFPESHPVYADTQVSTALGLIESGDLGAAEALLREARGKYGPGIDDAMRRGRVESELAGIALLRHRPQAARTLLASASDNLRSRAYWMLPMIADARRLLVCKQAPSPDCPGDLEARVAADATSHAKGGHPQLLIVETILARADQKRGNDNAASLRLTRAIANARRELPADHPRVLEARLWLAVAAARNGDCAIASSEASDVVRLEHDRFPGGHPFLAEPRTVLASHTRCPRPAPVD